MPDTMMNGEAVNDGATTFASPALVTVPDDALAEATNALVGRLNALCKIASQEIAPG
ncbi:hypothetical protein [Mesorhizobium sp. WSM3860]|uniref:hypothetical protein n=1 Tax=Mesorhizobium sp. WSM3860 TaxID=2029403 RepID=UPI001FE16C51|nr:hypothetical protein [Mesorhizobium sp. WSM3860]